MKDIARQLDSVYREHRAAIYHTALTLLKNTASAEDVMQEVFLSYYRELQQGKPVRHLRTWLLTVTRNRCLNILRNTDRELPVEELPAVVTDDPMQNVQQQDMVEQVLACLTQDERLAFSLHCLNGYTYRQIAAGLGIPVGTVQTRCHTARQKLRAELQRLNKREEAYT